jgi:hypothetical protein
MADSEQDDEFEAYLKRRVPIDQRMKSVDRLEPPAELDRVIIGKARNAIQNSPPVPVYRAPKWALPVGLAATLLIAFSIVWDLGVRTGRQHAAVSPAPAVAAVAQAPAAPTVPGPSAAASQEPAPAEAVAPDTGVGEVAAAKRFARMQPPPIKTAPWPPLQRSAAAKPAVAPSDAATAAVGSARTESAAEFDQRSRAADRRVAEKRLRTEDSERVAAANVGSPAASAAAGAVAPAPAAPPPRPLVDATANAGTPTPMRLAASSPQVSAVTFDGTKVTAQRSAERLDSKSGGPVARAAAETAAMAAPSTAAIAAADRREHPDPKVWLDQIQKMRAGGLTAQAEQELQRFRDAYPAYATPSPDGGAQ